MKKILLTIVPALMLSCASSHQQESNLDEPQSHELLTIAARDFEINTEFAATIKGLQDISVIPRIEGYLQGIFVKEFFSMKTEKSKK